MQSIGDKIMPIDSNTKPLIEFNPKLPKLSKNESKVLKFLVEAGRLVVPIYLEQEKQTKTGISRKELEKAAKTDTKIFSPYTVVEKTNSKLVAVPYHIKYERLLKPVAKKLNEASRITENKEFGRFLQLQAKALLDGSYEKALAASVRMKPYILDIYIGPSDYFNRLFAGKAAYQAWVGVLDVAGTERLNNYRTTVFNASRKALVPNERVENFNHIKAKTIDEVLFSGLMARRKFVGFNEPMNLDWVEKYGSEVTIFNQANDLRLKEQVMPIFNKIFSPAFRQGFSSEDLRRGSLRYVALHELAHNYLYYRNSAQNLQDLLPVIFELTATLLGMRIAGSLLLIDRITNKQLESMIVTFVCRSFDLVDKSKKDKFMINYTLGGAIFINYMLASGAIRQKEGMTIPNFTKIFLSLHELSYVMERLLSSGTRKEAEAFIKKYGRIN